MLSRKIIFSRKINLKETRQSAVPLGKVKKASVVLSLPTFHSFGERFSDYYRCIFYSFYHSIKGVQNGITGPNGVA
jgi:hypothetical protein